MSADDIPALRAALIEPTGPPRRFRRKACVVPTRRPISNVHGFPVFTLSRPGAEELPARRSVSTCTAAPTCAPADRPALAVRDPAGRRTGRACGAAPLPARAGVHRRGLLRRRWSSSSRRSRAESPEGVVLVGDSAGGGYALALAEALRDRGGPQPDRLVLIAPWVDLTGTAPGTLEAAERDPWLSHPHLSSTRRCGPAPTTRPRSQPPAQPRSR